uniref:ZP domain-containing protein n=1 Tax=Strongyloides papillosus TaxID=174720 RepID=A0A0N5BEB8_STREA
MFTCNKKNHWVGGIEYIDHPRQPLILQCCSFEGLKFSQEVGTTRVNPNEAINGGEVIRNGRQISFDVISNVKKVVEEDGNKIGYEVTVRRMNCLPDPPEPTVNVDEGAPEEIVKVLEIASATEKKAMNNGINNEVQKKNEQQNFRQFGQPNVPIHQNYVNNKPIQAPVNGQQGNIIPNNQVPQQGYNNQVPQQGYNNQVPQQGYNNQVPQQGYNNQVPQQGYNNQVPQQGYNNQVPQQGYNNQQPYNTNNNANMQQPNNNNNNVNNVQRPYNNNNNNNAQQPYAVQTTPAPFVFPTLPPLSLHTHTFPPSLFSHLHTLPPHLQHPGFGAPQQSSAGGVPSQPMPFTFPTMAPLPTHPTLPPIALPQHPAMHGAAQFQLPGFPPLSIPSLGSFAPQSPPAQPTK